MDNGDEKFGHLFIFLEVKKMKNLLVFTIILFCSYALCMDFPDTGTTGANRQVGGQRADRLREQKQQAEQVFSKSKADLEFILKSVSAGEDVSQEKIDDIKRDFMASRQVLRYLEKEQQSDLFVLDAWLNYFETKDATEALKRSERGSVLNPISGDAYASSVVFSSLLGQAPKSEDMLLRRAGGRRDEQAVMSDSVLNVEVSQFSRALIGSKVPLAAAGVMKEDAFSCVLIWTLKPEPIDDEVSKRLKAAAASLTPEQRAMLEQITDKEPVSSDYVKKQIEAFGLLYEGNISDNVDFISVSFDDFEVVSEYNKSNNPKPTPIPAGMMGQDIGGEARQAINIEGVIMLIIDKDNTVRYSGSADGFLPIMLLNELVPDSQKKPQSPAKQKELPAAGEMMMPEFMPEQTPPIKDTKPSDSNSLPSDKAQLTQDQELTLEQRQANTDKLTPEQKVEAENLLSQASMFRGSHTRLGSSRRAIESCLEIIDKFKGTTYELQAKEIIDSVPEHQKRRYGL